MLAPGNVHVFRSQSFQAEVFALLSVISCMLDAFCHQ